MAAPKLVSACDQVAAAATLVCCLLLSMHPALSLPLSASSHWLVAQPTGSRVRLACVNWASHLTPLIAEGLHVHPLHSIAHTIASWGFNCVRLSYAPSMFTNSTLSEARIAQVFRDLGLEEELHGLARFNGKLVGMTSVEAFKEVVGALGREGLMVVLDNCARTPGRGRCGEVDESYGLLGNAGSEAQEIWIQGLQTVAALFKGWPNVVGMSVRYELQRAPQEWQRQMQRGAEAIHKQNPDLLVFLGGSSSTQYISFMSERLLPHTLKHKLVHEVRYKISSNTYTEGDMEAHCDAVVKKMMEEVGSLISANKSHTHPLLMVGEFGGQNQGKGLRGEGAAPPCLSSFVARGDLNWAAWPLQGSYYLRGGVQDDDEVFGLFDHRNAPRNALLMHGRQALQLSSVQDESWHRPHKVLFHPATRLCVNKVHMKGLQMGSCSRASYWKLTPQGLIALDSSYMVISAQGAGQPAMLALQGLQPNGPWTLSNGASVQYMQMSTVVSGETLCLDAPSPAKLLTNRCLCSDPSCRGDLTSQCFIFVSSS